MAPQPAGPPVSTSNEKTLNRFGRFEQLPLFAWTKLDSGGLIRALQGLS